MTKCGQGWSLDAPGLPNTRYRVEGRFKKFALLVLTNFTDAGLGDNNAIVPSYAPTHHFPPNRSEMEAVYVVGDDDWNPFFRTRRWERTLDFVYDFADYRVAALKPFLWEKPDSWVARAYLQGHDDIAADEVKVWGQIEYGKVTRGHLWVIVRTYKHPKGQTVAAAPGAIDSREPDAVLPMETALLGNYPNPFNPETWIPYHLATDADVTITIYDAKGSDGASVRFGESACGILHKSASRRVLGRPQRKGRVGCQWYLFLSTSGVFIPIYRGRRLFCHETDGHRQVSRLSKT